MVRGLDNQTNVSLLYKVFFGFSDLQLEDRKKVRVKDKHIVIETCVFLNCIICLSFWTNLDICFMLKDETYLDLENHPLCSIPYEDQWVDTAKWDEIRGNKLNHWNNELAGSEGLPFMIGIYKWSHTQI